MIETEQSAKARPPLHVRVPAHGKGRAVQQLVVESLVVALAMVVRDVQVDEPAEVSPAAFDCRMATRDCVRPRRTSAGWVVACRLPYARPGPYQPAIL